VRQRRYTRTEETIETNPDTSTEGSKDQHLEDNEVNMSLSEGGPCNQNFSAVSRVPGHSTTEH
jgi:hypothetical protein